MIGTITEPARQTPVLADYDVVVCGGGPAGVAAAVSAARAGARTCLLEMHGSLGGIWTLGRMAFICGMHQGKAGILREIVAELTAREAVGLSGRSFDIEATKLLLDQLCLEAGVRIRLHTRVVDVVLDHNNRVSTVITESKSGREAWCARVFIDCTGDGDVAALAGCGFDVGRPDTGETQPMSFVAVLSGLHLDDVRPYTNARDPEPGQSRIVHKDRLRELLDSAGTSPSYSLPTLFHVRDDLFMLMANHEYGKSGLDADQITQATLHGRAEVHAQVQALRRLGGAWEDVHIVATSDQIGVREARRIHGRYTVTTQDLIAGARHPDAVSRCHFGVDIHTTDPAQDKGLGNDGIRSVPYDIPLRALIAKDVDGLMMAGRCISGDFFAHASYRVTAEAVPMGEAAGRAAAQAATGIND